MHVVTLPCRTVQRAWRDPIVKQLWPSCAAALVSLRTACSSDGLLAEQSRVVSGAANIVWTEGHTTHIRRATYAAQFSVDGLTDRRPRPSRGFLAWRVIPGNSTEAASFMSGPRNSGHFAAGRTG